MVQDPVTGADAYIIREKCEIRGDEEYWLDIRV